MRKKTLLTATAVALVAVSFPLESGSLFFGTKAAWAQEEDPEITAEAKKHYKLGQDAYTDGKYDLAIKELKRAYVLKRIPAILVNIAMTYRKTKDYEMSIYFYKKFLVESAPDDKQRPSVETAITEVEQERAAASQPQLAPAKPAVELAKPAVDPAKPAVDPVKPVVDGSKATVDGSKATVDGSKATADGSKATADGSKATADGSKATVDGSKATVDSANPMVGSLAAPVEAGTVAKTGGSGGEKASTEWAHTPIDTVPPGQPVDIRVQMPVMKGVKVRVHFRKEGQAAYENLELKRRGNEKVARIPDSVAQGRSFQYYIEAKDTAGTVVKSIGSDLSPNLVLVDPTARPQNIGSEMVADAADDDEVAKRKQAGPTRDIENEQASFDLGGQSAAMARLRQQLRERDKDKKRGKGKQWLGALGWSGSVLAVVGLGGLVGGGVLLGTASSYADVVSSDSACTTKVKVNNEPQCPHFGPNENPEFSKTLKPATYEYERKGLQYDKIGTALTVAGGVALAGGAAMLTVDLIKRYGKEKPKAPRTRKVKKVIEVEEPMTSWMIAPSVGPGSIGVVSLFNY